jgi:hypothetical protein
MVGGFLKEKKPDRLRLCKIIFYYFFEVLTFVSGGSGAHAAGPAAYQPE